MRLLEWVLSELCHVSDSQQVSRLKKKIRALDARLENTQSHFQWSQFGLKQSEKRREESEKEAGERCRLLSESLDSTQEEVLSLRENSKVLEQSLAEAKSQLALNALEKELMADLFEKLRQKVRADIACVSDSYVNVRPEQFADGFQAPGRGPGPGV